MPQVRELSIPFQLFVLYRFVREKQQQQQKLLHQFKNFSSELRKFSGLRGRIPASFQIEAKINYGIHLFLKQAG